MRQQEEAEYRSVGNLVVKRLTVEVQEGWVDADIVPEVKINLVHIYKCRVFSIGLLIV